MTGQKIIRRGYKKMRKKQKFLNNFSIRISIAIIAMLLIAMATLPVASALGTVTSCDSNGTEIDQFAPGESVYVKATGLVKNKNYKIWIQDDQVNESDPLIVGGNPSSAETPKDVTTDKSIGNFGPTLIWSIPPDAQITYHKYDIVVDYQIGANVGVYDSANDGLDSASAAGMIAPVPDVSSLILFTSGLVLVSVYFVYGSRREKWKEEL